MDPPARVNQPMYSGRTTRRGSVGSGSAHRGEDGSHSGTGNGYQANVRVSNGDNHYHDLLKTIYVSNITASMPDDVLWEAFGQFGRVDSLVRRDVNVDMNNNTEQQYAFIRYRNRQDARYAIAAGEINFYGRKLLIRPRDKPAYMKHNGGFVERSRDPEGYERIRSRSFQGPERRLEQRGNVDIPIGYSISPGMQSTSGAAPAEMLSKVLTVANLPADMSPKELYDLFANYGSVERSYIYQQADALGRRFGEVTMGSFFFAQKAIEGLNTFSIRGILLDVSYKVNPQNIATLSPDAFGVARNYAWAIGSQMQWPYQMYGGNGPATQSVHAGPQYNQQSSGIVVPYTMWNTPGTANAIPASYGFPGVSVHALHQGHHPPVCIYSPQHANSGHIQRLHTASNSYTSKGSLGNSIGEATDGTLAPDSGSRSVSGASSATLVASTEAGFDKKYASPVIVTSPTYSEHCVGVKPMASPTNSVGEVVQEGIQPHSTEIAHGHQLVPLALVPPSQYETAITLPPAPSAAATKVFDPTKPAFVPETPKPRDPSNLYIKNLDDGFITTTMDLKAAFGQYGQIASAFLATYPNGTSKGFGFVAFVNPSDAVVAKESLDGVILGRKRVFVTFAERKEERTQRLKELFESKREEAKTEVLPALPKDSDREEPGEVTPLETSKLGATISREDNTVRVPGASEPTCRDPSELTLGGSQAEGEVTVTTTVTTTKAWKGTQLQGIVEVEEEESPCTKKCRQQRIQNHVQQRQGDGQSIKDSRPTACTRTETPPSSENLGPLCNPMTHGGTRAEAHTGSPRPRPRQNGVQPQRRSQSPRNCSRPFYPPGRGECVSPKPLARHASSPTPTLGSSTGPRAQMSGNRNGGIRDTGQKKKRAGRRANDPINGLVFEQGSNRKTHLEEEGHLLLPARNYDDQARSGETIIDMTKVTTHFDDLEVHSEP